MHIIIRRTYPAVGLDVKKAFDSVSHQWIIRTLEMHGIHNSLIHLIMKTWRNTLEVNTSNGKEKIGLIKVNREILQGDSFCVRLFTPCTESHCMVLTKHRGILFVSCS